MNQREAFRQFEGDGWFRRNSSVKKNYSREDDPVISLIKEYGIVPQRFLEIGCSYGYRVNGIKQTFPEAEAFGIEASPQAVDFGKNQFKNISLECGLADDLAIYPDSHFDVVVAGFVFYVIDRELLMKTAYQIDRVLKDKGFVIILDFFSDRKTRNAYQHIIEFEAFAYKQRYESLFLGSMMYQLLDKSTLQYTDLLKKYSGSDYSNNLSLVLLKKDVHAAY